jgi:hypothetical protein
LKIVVKSGCPEKSKDTLRLRDVAGLESSGLLDDSGIDSSDRGGIAEYNDVAIHMTQAVGIVGIEQEWIVRFNRKAFRPDNEDGGEKKESGQRNHNQTVNRVSPPGGATVLPGSSSLHVGSFRDSQSRVGHSVGSELNFIVFDLQSMGS